MNNVSENFIQSIQGAYSFNQIDEQVSDNVNELLEISVLQQESGVSDYKLKLINENFGDNKSLLRILLLPHCRDFINSCSPKNLGIYINLCEDLDGFIAHSINITCIEIFSVSKCSILETLITTLNIENIDMLLNFKNLAKLQSILKSGNGEVFGYMLRKLSITTIDDFEKLLETNSILGVMNTIKGKQLKIDFIWLFKKFQITNLEEYINLTQDSTLLKVLTNRSLCDIKFIIQKFNINTTDELNDLLSIKLLYYLFSFVDTKDPNSSLVPYIIMRLNIKDVTGVRSLLQLKNIYKLKNCHIEYLDYFEVNTLEDVANVLTHKYVNGQRIQQRLFLYKVLGIKDITSAKSIDENPHFSNIFKKLDDYDGKGKHIFLESIILKYGLETTDKIISTGNLEKLFKQGDHENYDLIFTICGKNFEYFSDTIKNEVLSGIIVETKPNVLKTVLNIYGVVDPKSLKSFLGDEYALMMLSSGKGEMLFFLINKFGINNINELTQKYQLIISNKAEKLLLLNDLSILDMLIDYFSIEFDQAGINYMKELLVPKEKGNNISEGVSAYGESTSCDLEMLRINRLQNLLERFKIKSVEELLSIDGFYNFLLCNNEKMDIFCKKYNINSLSDIKNININRVFCLLIEGLNYELIDTFLSGIHGLKGLEESTEFGGVFGCSNNERTNNPILAGEKSNFIAIELYGEIVGHIKMKGERSFLSYVNYTDEKGDLVLVKGGIYYLDGIKEIVKKELTFNNGEYYFYKMENINVNICRVIRKKSQLLIDDFVASLENKKGVLLQLEE